MLVTTRCERWSVFAWAWARAKRNRHRRRPTCECPSLPFELSRLLHGASVRQLPCQLVHHRVSGLADIYSHSRARIRAHASSPMSHERWNSKSDPYFHAVHSTTLVPRRDISRGHSRVMTCCRVIDCPEKHVCAAGILHNRGQVVDLFSSGVFVLSIDFPRAPPTDVIVAYVNLYVLSFASTGTLTQNFQLWFIPFQI